MKHVVKPLALLFVLALTWLNLVLAAPRNARHDAAGARGEGSRASASGTGPSGLAAAAPAFIGPQAGTGGTAGTAGEGGEGPGGAPASGPTLDTPILGGLTARREQQISAAVRLAHHDVATAPGGSTWTPAMGATALARAQSWLGLPYSWAGGNGVGPTTGVCAGGGAELDCQVVGFDCSGLTQHAWWPYTHLAHYAATQRTQAGAFHPTVGQLAPGDLVFFAGYIPGGVGHTAVYAGDGWVVEADQSGTLITRSRLADVSRASTYQGATRPMTTDRQGAGPAVSTMTWRGDTLTITGRNLATTTSVSVAGTLVYDVRSRSDRQVVVSVPSGLAGTTRVSVSNLWGSGSIRAPHLQTVSPATVPTAGATITLAGTYLAAVDRVTLDGASVRFTHLANGSLAVTLPAHRSGGAALQVRSPWGVSNAAGVTYAAPASSPPTTSAPPTSTPPTTSAPPTRTPPTSGTSTAPVSTPPASTSPTTGSTTGSTDPGTSGPTGTASAAPDGTATTTA